MAHFEEKSGIVPCVTCWGKWWQTMDEIHIEVDVPEGTRGKEIVCNITTKKIKLVVRGGIIIEGEYLEVVQADDSVWTLEDRKQVHICLVKGLKRASSCWKSLLVGQYEADPLVYDSMQKKLTLQRYQYENPGMDFSGANISGNYQGGGPDMPGS